MRGRRWKQGQDIGPAAGADVLHDDLQIAWEEADAAAGDSCSAAPAAPGDAPGGGEVQAATGRAAVDPRGAAPRTVRVGDLFSARDIPVHALRKPCACGSAEGYRVQNEEFCAGCRRVLSRSTRKRH